MSLLDLDEELARLADVVDVVRSPLVDRREAAFDVCLVEGGVCNTDNLEVLRDLRIRSKLLIAVGACALNGGVPALRNGFSVAACLEEAFHDEMSPRVPDDPELPQLLDKVRPIHEFVRVDFSIPGCPPPPRAFWETLSCIARGEKPAISADLLRYD